MEALLKETGLGSHLQETLLHLIDTQPKIHPEFLEAISKKPPVKTAEDLAQEVEQCKLNVQPLKQEVPPAEGEEPPAEPVKVLPPVIEDVFMGDVLGDLSMLERAGVGFGTEENYRLFLALKGLATQTPVPAPLPPLEPPAEDAGEKIARVRLWGKLLGQNADYYVAECSLAGRQPVPPLPADLEGQPKSWVPPDPVGDEGECYFMTSTNQFVYFVSPSTSGPWTRLPDTNPTTLTQSYHVRRFLTGDLTAPVLSKSPFAGREADLVRCLIARITADTRLAPRGHLADTTDYENFGDLEVGLSEAGSFLGMSGQQLCELAKSAWVHASLDILAQGRNKYHDIYGWTPPEDKPEMRDPREQKNRPALQSVYLDKAHALGTAAWSARVCAPKAPQYSPGVVRSNVWPGALSVGWGYQFVNFYCGWGLPETGCMFSPPTTFQVQVEPDHPEFKRNAKCMGWKESGDLNLEEPPKPEEGEAAAE